MNLFIMKDIIDNSIYALYNMISRIWFLFSLLQNRNLLARNKIFKNKHHKERCFIIGNGPSLKGMKLDFLNNEVTFCVNHFYKSEWYDKIKCTYHVVADAYMLNKVPENFNNFKKIIVSHPNTTFIFNIRAKPIIKQMGINDRNVYYTYPRIMQYGDLIAIDMTKNMTTGFNVVNICIEYALYMGFNEIYLLGCDFNSFASLRPQHCYDEDSNEPDRLISIGFELKCYYLPAYSHYALEKFSQKKGIGIFNATPGSLIDAYKRIDIGKIMKLELED